jgi:hypothetical protein
MRTRQHFVSRLALRLLPLAPAALLVGCSDPTPIDPAVLATQAALSAREVVHQAGGGASFVQQEDSGLSRIASGMGHASDGLQGMAQMIPPGMAAAMSDSPMAMAAAGLPSLQTTEEQWDDTADDLRMWLRDRVLADENLETKSASEAVYLLHAEPTCRALSRPGDPPGLPELNASCVQDLAKLEIRVVLRADGDGVRLTMQVGPDRLELSSFIIHSDLIAIEATLPKTYKATQFISQALGEDNPMGNQQFEALAGTVRVSLKKDGERKATFAIGVLDAIHVALKSATGEPGPDVHVAATNPVFALSADGVEQTATLKLDVGAVDVLTDWDPQGGALANRDLEVAIGGITGSTTFREATDSLSMKGLGIGPTSIKVRGVPLVDLGLNPSDMNRFDLDLLANTAGEVELAVKPRFDLSVGLHFNSVTADFARENQPPSWALDETYRILFDNGGAPATLAGAPATDTFGGGLKIGAGTLTLSSNKAASATVTVPAGKCLTHNPNPAADAHPILGALMSADCP